MIFGLSLLYWGLWLAILILWMGRFVTSFLSIYLVSALRLDEGVVGTVVAMYGFGAIIGCLFGGWHIRTSRRMRRKIDKIVGDAKYMYIQIRPPIHDYHRRNRRSGCPAGRFRTH